METPIYDAVLWDFGDTLADETWMLDCPSGADDWSQVFIEQIWQGDLGRKWNCGHVSVHDVAAALSDIVGMRPEDLLSHFHRCCQNIRFFDQPMATVKKLDCMQAVVTVNPDIFTEWIVPSYELGELFQVTIASWQIGSVDKNALCDAAISKLGGAISTDRVLLVDNTESNVLAWRKQGGQAYHFVDEETFGHDAQKLFGPPD